VWVILKTMNPPPHRLLKATGRNHNMEVRYEVEKAAEGPLARLRSSDVSVSLNLARWACSTFRRRNLYGIFRCHLPYPTIISHTLPSSGSTPGSSVIIRWSFIPKMEPPFTQLLQISASADVTLKLGQESLYTAACTLRPHQAGSNRRL